jgi:hypothetical protein
MTAADNPKGAKGMKSAYELALERLESQGIDRPSATTLSEEQKRKIADARSLTESKLAELEILHRDKMAKLADPVKAGEQEEFYRLEKERLDRELEAKLVRIRGD